MTGPARSKVIWWGPHVPTDIARELQGRDLELSISEELASVSDPKVRAVLLPHHPRKGIRALQARARRLLEPVMNHGGRLIVVVFGEVEWNEAVVQTGNLPVRVLDATAASRVAEACARMDPGPHAGDVDVRPGPRTRLTPSDTILLRRAFADFASIDVNALRGGLSGAAVLRIEATDKRGKSPQPFLVKIGSVDDITTEIDTMREFVISHIPFPHQPPLYENRCVTGCQHRLLVSALVDRAKRLDDYLADERAVEGIITSLFDGPLRCWRNNSSVSAMRIGMVYEDRVRGSLRAGSPRIHDAALTAARDLARAHDASTPDPFDVLARLRTYPERNIKSCQIHGDLHPRNIFVRDNSNDTILIDFAKSGNLGAPKVLDPATLDVALAFDGWEDSATALELDEIARLYAPPIFRISDKGLSHRGKAIPRVRLHGREDCVDETEYQAALVACLLRTARLLAKGTEMAKTPNPKALPLLALAIQSAHRLAVELP